MNKKGDYEQNVVQLISNSQLVKWKMKVKRQLEDMV